jgi:hypothetical protein
VTVYPAIGLPPSLAGADQLTVAVVLPASAVTLSGVPGTVAGVTALEGEDAGPVPIALVAVTVNVYDVPLTRPLTVQPADVLLQVAPPGAAVAV